MSRPNPERGREFLSEEPGDRIGRERRKKDHKRPDMFLQKKERRPKGRAAEGYGPVSREREREKRSARAPSSARGALPGSK